MEDKEAQEKIIASVLLEETMRSEVAADMVAKRIRQRLDACCTPILTPEEEALGYKLAVVDEKAELLDYPYKAGTLSSSKGAYHRQCGWDKCLSRMSGAGFTAKIVRLI